MTILVRTYKFDGSEHRSWSARLLRQDGPLIILDARFSEEVVHDLLGTIESDTHSLEYYWLDRWYNVFRFNERFYCNLTKPPIFDGSILTYVDLDIDVLVESDFSYKILDLEDFENSSYPTDLKEQALQALEELLSLVETRSFPFNE